MNNSNPTNTYSDTSVAFSSRTNAELKKAHLLFSLMNYQKLTKVGTNFIKLAFGLRLPLKGLVKKTLFRQFCGGEDIAECTTTINKLAQFNIGTILDYSVEGEKTEKGFESTKNEIIRTIEAAHQNSHIPFSVFKVTGVASFDTLQAVQQGKQPAGFEQARQRVDQICARAHQHNVRLLVDAEESWIQGTIDQLVYEMMAKYNRQRPIIYNTFQMYRNDMLANLKQASAQARQQGYYLGAKIVRGAYLEKERQRAKELNYKDPTQPDKLATDRDFNEAIKFCVANKAHMALCCGSHNEYSNQLLTQLMQQQGIDKQNPDFYFSQLYGMSDNISFSLAKQGYNVVKYVPYGPVKAVLPYLFRRAEENTSIAGQSSRELNMIKNEIKRRKATAKNGA